MRWPRDPQSAQRTDLPAVQAERLKTVSWRRARSGPMPHSGEPSLEGPSSRSGRASSQPLSSRSVRSCVMAHMIGHPLTFTLLSLSRATYCGNAETRRDRSSTGSASGRRRGMASARRVVAFLWRIVVLKQTADRDECMGEEAAVGRDRHLAAGTGRRSRPIVSRRKCPAPRAVFAWPSPSPRHQDVAGPAAIPGVGHSRGHGCRSGAGSVLLEAVCLADR